MRTHRAVTAALKNRLLPALGLVIALVLAGPAASGAAPAPSVLTFKTVKIGAAGNPSVGIVPSPTPSTPPAQKS